MKTLQLLVLISLGVVLMGCESKRTADEAAALAAAKAAVSAQLRRPETAKWPDPQFPVRTTDRGEQIVFSGSVNAENRSGDRRDLSWRAAMHKEGDRWVVDRAEVGH